MLLVEAKKGVGFMPDDDGRYRRVVAIGTEPHPGDLQVARRSLDREPDIKAPREIGRDVIITEAIDDSDGTSRITHAGEDPKLHQILLVERAHLLRLRVSEEQRSRRLLAWLASALILG